MNVQAVAQLQKYLRQSEEWDNESAALVFSEHNRLYLTGFPATDGAMLVTADDAALFMDFRYAEAARRVVTVCPVIEFSAISQAVIPWLKEHGIKKLHTETESFTLEEFSHYNKIMQQVNGQALPDRLLDNCLREIRMIKTPEEVASIEKAQKITEEAFDYACSLIQPGKTEQEIAVEIEFFMRRKGGRKSVFRPDRGFWCQWVAVPWRSFGQSDRRRRFCHHGYRLCSGRLYVGYDPYSGGRTCER